jgi:TetR/AcrR family transcriptional regulator, copper-responsive repressor
MARQRLSSDPVQKDPPPSRPRGRPRAYDPAQALAAATGAFWQAGYSATSLDALSEATGMNRPSLYGAFGDKRALYLQALQAYADGGQQAMRTALAPERPLREGLKRVYDTALKIYYPPQQPARGCLLIGTAAVEALQDDGIRALLQRSLRVFDTEFERRFVQGQAAGELRADADPALLARLASALLHTLALRSRAGDSRAQLAATAAAGIEQLLR